MARRSKLKSQLKDHNESIKEKNELAAKVLTEDENKDTGDEEVGVMDALKKIVSGPSEEDVQNVEEKKAEEAKAKAEAEAKERAKKMHELPTYLL